MLEQKARIKAVGTGGKAAEGHGGVFRSSGFGFHAALAPQTKANPIKIGHVDPSIRLFDF
jgi:hypothetical protein